MTPFYFGRPERQLFGIFEARQPECAPRGAVLLAAPFGHEAIRTHRLYRVLADRLARLGFDSLRFDYHGTGDSSGDDRDTSLAGWVDDIVVADAELARLGGSAAAWWVGARLGATALLQAAPTRSANAPPALLMWDPIVDGPGYLVELRERHVEALEASYSVADSGWRRRAADVNATEIDEAIGFAISPAFAAEIAALRPVSLHVAPTTRMVVVASPGNEEAAAWAAAQPNAPPLRKLQHDFEWTSDDSLKSALVPGDALAELWRAVDGHALA